jgi:tryptophanyl-tRNA synthetase
MGYGEAKQALYEKADAFFSAARDRRLRLAEDEQTVRDILAAGAAKARSKAREVLDRARDACGLSHRT